MTPSTDRESAYQRLTSMVGPDASKEEMEAAINSAFGDVPGFGGAYKESVMLDGQWYDLVGSYGGPNAVFHGLMAKKESSQEPMSALASPNYVETRVSRLVPAGASPIAPVAQAAYAPLVEAPPMRDLAYVGPFLGEKPGRNGPRTDVPVSRRMLP